MEEAASRRTNCKHSANRTAAMARPGDCLKHKQIPMEMDCQERREKQSLLDDVMVLVAVVIIFLLAVAIVGVKSLVLEEVRDGNVSTFRPLTQKKDSNMKNTGMGFLPCEG